MSVTVWTAYDSWTEMRTAEQEVVAVTTFITDVYFSFLCSFIILFKHSFIWFCCYKGFLFSSRWLCSCCCINVQQEDWKALYSSLYSGFLHKYSPNVLHFPCMHVRQRARVFDVPLCGGLRGEALIKIYIYVDLSKAQKKRRALEPVTLCRKLWAWWNVSGHGLRRIFWSCVRATWLRVHDACVWTSCALLSAGVFFFFIYVPCLCVWETPACGCMQAAEHRWVMA